MQGAVLLTLCLEVSYFHVIIPYSYKERLSLLDGHNFSS